MKIIKIIKIISVAVVLVAVVVFVFIYMSRSTKQQVSKLDTIDTVGGFYNQWLKAAQEPATAVPDRATLARSPLLSKTLRDRLVSAEKLPETSPDPVLCQTVVPANISIRSVFTNADRAQVLVMSRDKKETRQATVTLIKFDGGWYFDDIQCLAGEFGPDREFSFETAGYLLKGLIPKPYNSKDWHVIYEEDGVLGNVVPIFFDSKSQCTNLEGVKSVCDPAKFVETTKVSIRGQMTERGVTINLLEFLK